MIRKTIKDDTIDKDDDYIPTASQVDAEKDKEFDINKYVNKVKMKQEEDAAEQKDRQQKVVIAIVAATSKSKHKSQDRSLHLQDVGPSQKKKFIIPQTTKNSPCRIIT